MYLQHADGSVTWYGHLKNGSVTAKAPGAAVAAGERLGTVGSSGNSGGPHLHFEVHDSLGAPVDPYSGPCSPAAGLWATPRPYYEPTLNAVLTHSAAPVFNPCPAPETSNESSFFPPGSSLLVGAYYHDQLAGQPTQFTIYRPDNSVFVTWTHASPAPHYVYSYWLWGYGLPANAPVGQWRIEALYQGTTTRQAFTVGIASAVKAPARKPLYAVYPNPATTSLRLAGPLPIARVQLIGPTGQLIYSRLHYCQPTLDLPPQIGKGLYLVCLLRTDGTQEQHRVVIE